MTTVAERTQRPVRSALSARRIVAMLGLFVAIVGWVAWSAWAQSRPFEWSGTVETRTITVGSRVGGRVKEVVVREGDAVVEGQPVVLLEVGDLDAQRLAAQGQLEQAKAALQKLEKGARPEEIAAAKARAATARAAYLEARAGSRAEQIAAARARLREVEAQNDKAQVDAERARRLFASKAISQAELEASDSSLRAIAAQRDAAKAALDELENGVRREELAQAEARASEAEASMKLVTGGSRVEDIEAARGAMDAAEGRLKQVLVMIEELTVRAPRDARVESLDLRPGDILAPNAPAATLLESGQLYVRIYVPETQIGHLRVGADVPVFVDSFPGKPFRGSVEHVDYIGQYTPRNLQTADERADQVFAARVGVRDPGGTLRAGMAAVVRVPR